MMSRIDTFSTSAPSRIKSIAMRVFRVLVALIFLAAAWMKISGQPMMVEEFDKIGLGQWFRFFTGAIELVGAIAVLIPRYSAIGALVLLIVDVGAFVAQVTVLHVDWIHTVVIGAALALLAFLERRSITSFRL